MYFSRFTVYFCPAVLCVAVSCGLGHVFSIYFLVSCRIVCGGPRFTLPHSVWVFRPCARPVCSCLFFARLCLLCSVLLCFPSLFLCACAPCCMLVVPRPLRHPASCVVLLCVLSASWRVQHQQSFETTTPTWIARAIATRAGNAAHPRRTNGMQASKTSGRVGLRGAHTFLVWADARHVGGRMVFF